MTRAAITRTTRTTRITPATSIWAELSRREGYAIRRLRLGGGCDSVPIASRRLGEGGVIMELDQTYVWITPRRLKPGARDEFSRAWRPSEFPEGLLRSYASYSPDGHEVVGISPWDSPESRAPSRLSDVETRRRPAIAPSVIDETTGFYVRREL